MSTSVTLQKTEDAFAPPLAKPFDESVWQAWVLKGREQEERSHAAAMKVVTWISLVTLLLAAEFWSQIAPYGVAARFILTAGGLVLMFQAFHTRHYAFATVFGALALLYNPVVPVFNFSGEWRSVFVMASRPVHRFTHLEKCKAGVQCITLF